MTDRSIRRAAERKALKLARKEANRANAQQSTGPKTEAGKAASSQNRRTYGLTGAFVVLPHEDENEYQALYEGLVKEHQPATETEQILVKKMAQHQWMADRALYQQANCFYKEDFFAFEKQISLFMRYHTMHDRAFHKAMTELRKAQKERQQQELGVPQLKAQALEANLALKQAKSTALKQNGFESKKPAPHQTSPTKTEPASVSEQQIADKGNSRRSLKWLRIEKRLISKATPRSQLPTPPPKAKLSTLMATPGSLFCTECGKPAAEDDLFEFQGRRVCLECKPAFAQRLRQGGTLQASSVSAEYGGFWIRFAARVIDSLILGVVTLAVNGLLIFVFRAPGRIETVSPAVTALLLAVNFILALIYEVFFLVRNGATPGKMVLSLKVVTPDGGPISSGRAIARFLCYYLDNLTLLIGYIIAAFDAEKRALHDHICSTRVVRHAATQTLLGARA